jgi:RNA polymerase sigma-70 factor (ECF subfamily)
VSTGKDVEFTALVERQSRFAFRVAYAVLLNAADAEDAVQETFLKLYRSGEWREARNERAYMARVAWRAAVDRRRALGRPEDGCDEMPERAAAEADPEEQAVMADRAARVHAMIDALPEELRVPLAMAANEEMNSREIGEALGIPEGTVRTRLQRARQMLRRKLAGLEAARYA